MDLHTYSSQLLDPTWSLLLAMCHKILLLLGAGANVGTAAVKMFHGAGYKVVSVARTIRPEVKAYSDLVLTADFSDASSIQGIFDKTEKEIGVPNVVIYNRECQQQLLKAGGNAICDG